MNREIADIRKDYKLKSLSENEVSINPYNQFGIWWKEAIESNLDEVNAMTLSTASKEGRPSSRIMLLKGYDENGFVFFTNYNSRKGGEILANPFVSLLFFWKELERQVRIEGSIEKLENTYNDEYFYSRPIGSRISAWASNQSSILSNREELDASVAKYTQEFGDKVPRPAHWGGFRVVPDKIEFWQGRSSRLHDRVVYSLENTSWRINRLSP